ncbi:sugar ABC transporter substrate-binding protein [Ruminococcus sp. 5_1_39BFAA]|uniref:sugar ABC transporter substrate-binding protein n=1 Tax=Ruminococcus sp. 5_1_39BFAA TaxID=457412 RepID=UPI0035630156
MSKIKKILTAAGGALIVIFLVMGFVAADGGRIKVKSDSVPETVEKEKRDKLIIGCTLASEQSDYQEELGNLMNDFAAKDDTYTLEICYAQWNVATQEEQMRNFIEEKVDAIILCPVNAKSFLNVLKEANQAGIPVINLNMKVDTVSSEYVAAYVGASMSEEAEMAATLAIGYFGGRYGRIGIIEGIPGSDPQIYRTQTFLEKLASHSNLEVVGIANGEWKSEKAKEAAVNLLKKNPDIDMIYCQDNYMSQGVYEVLKEQGIEEEVALIGIGNASAHMEDIKEGRLYGLVTQPPEFEAYYALECAKKSAVGESLRAWYKNKVEILTKQNVENYRSPMEDILNSQYEK